MAGYEYIALDDRGKRTKGVLTADSPRAARKALRLQGLMALDVSPLSADAAAKGAGRQRRGLSEKSRALLIRQFSVLLQSGLPVEQALAAAGDDGDERVGRIMTAVRTEVTEGARLPDAMAIAPKAFPPLVVALADAGVRSGQLPDVMNRLADYLETSYQMKQKVRAALFYPILLGVLAAVMIGLLMAFVVPRLVEQFDNLDAKLPPLTNAVIGVSNFVQSWWLALIIGAVAAVMGLRAMLKRPAVTAWLDPIVLKLPVIGTMVRTVAAARFARIFATVSASGGTVLEALDAARGAMTNTVFITAAAYIAQQVREGANFAPSLKATKAFPPMMEHMIMSGEQGRNVDGMMIRAADFLETEFETSTRTALSLLEPIIILALGGIIALIVLAIMLPIIQLNTFIPA